MHSFICLFEKHNCSVFENLVALFYLRGYNTGTVYEHDCPKHQIEEMFP